MKESLKEPDTCLLSSAISRLVTLLVGGPSQSLSLSSETCLALLRTLSLSQTSLSLLVTIKRAASAYSQSLLKFMIMFSMFFYKFCLISFQLSSFCVHLVSLSCSSFSKSLGKFCLQFQIVSIPRLTFNFKSLFSVLRSIICPSKIFILFLQFIFSQQSSLIVEQWPISFRIVSNYFFKLKLLGFTAKVLSFFSASYFKSSISCWILLIKFSMTSLETGQSSSVRFFTDILFSISAMRNFDFSFYLDFSIQRFALCSFFWTVGILSLLFLSNSAILLSLGYFFLFFYGSSACAAPSLFLEGFPIKLRKLLKGSMLDFSLGLINGACSTFFFLMGLRGGYLSSQSLCPKFDIIKINYELWINITQYLNNKPFINKYRNSSKLKLRQPVLENNRKSQVIMSLPKASKSPKSQKA